MNRVPAFALTLVILFVSGHLSATPADHPAHRLALAEREVAPEATYRVGDNPALHRPLAQLCGLVEPPGWEKSAAWVTLPGQKSLPARWDWREHGGVTPIRNQGPCGSCWAFATVSILESALLITEGLTTDLSEQALVDCDTSSNGCAGGWFAHDYHQVHGASLESCYPYTASDGPCQTGCTRPFRVDTWAYVGTWWGVVPPTDQIKQAILTYGPVAAAVAVSSTFQAYTGGVYNANDSTSINHAIVLVGWDDADGCWILRNSWGTGWGEGGYMRIAYASNQVGYAANVITPLPVSVPSLEAGDPQPDPHGDGRLSPGETADLIISLHNHGADASGITGSLQTQDQWLTVTQAQTTWPNLSRGASGLPLSPFALRVAPNAPPNHPATLQLTLTANGGYTVTHFSEVILNPDRVLVLDLDPNASSGPVIADALAATGVRAHRTTSHGADLTAYEAVFVCLGIYPANHVLSTAQANALTAYLDRGGRLYMEGGDAWFYDPARTIYLPYFHLSSHSDGAGDLSTQIGQANTPWAGLQLAYAGENNWVDRLAAQTGAQLAFANQSPAYGTAVAYAGPGYRTFGTSFEFGGLVDGTGLNTRLEVIRRLVAFFDLSRIGDIDGDGLVTAADALLLAIHLSGQAVLDSAAQERADAYPDGRLDALDLTLVQLASTD